MKGERLFQILGLIDEDLIEEAGGASSSAASKRRPRRSLRLAAACAAVVCISGAIFMLRDGLYLGGASMSSPGDSGSGGSGIAHNTEPLSTEETTFMSYAGPVFPLTLTEGIEGLTAERTTIWDFAPDTMESGGTRLWGSTVTDSYLLMNNTTGDILAMACYPVAGNFESLANDPPVVTMNHAETDWALYSGNYVGNFTHAGVEDGSTWNLNPPNSWSDYKSALGAGTYLEESMTSAPSLEQPVTVYEFSDFVLPENAPRAATLAFDCTIDPNKTQILSYGFNGFWMEDDGWRRYDFFVPDGTRRGAETDRKLLILLGEDIDSYTMQGYEDGGCDPNEILNGVSCTVSRRESTLEEVVNGICKTYAANFETDLFENPFNLISPDQFTDTVKKLMLQHGVLAEDQIKDRYSDGRLDELIPEVLYQDRVLYLAFPVSIPAGESVTISAEFRKEPSFDYGCSGSENVGLQGYDFVTQLGSHLEFTQQTASLVNTETIEIINQNFGFDLENGVSEVSLDPDTEHYYLEIREKNEQHTH